MPSTIDKDILILHYNSGKSMADIALILNCSVHKVTYWMTKYGIKKRSLSDAMYLKLNPNGDPFEIIKPIEEEDVFLLGLGLGIYWGEGDKGSKYAVRVTNSDPSVILTFVKFLKRICSVKDDKIHYSIICFNDSNIEDVKGYWSKILKISAHKFGKIVQIPPQGKGTYRKKSLSGVCSVTVSNMKLKKWIVDELEKLNYRLDGSVVERTLGKG